MRPTLIDFELWLRAKAEAHDRMLCLSSSRTKTTESTPRANKSKTTTKTFAANSDQKRPLSKKSGKWSHEKYVKANMVSISAL